MTSVNREDDCPYVENDELLRRYAAGKADGEDADRFEQHLLECDRCWSEMREIAHVRAALGDRKQLRRPAPTRRLTQILATAAALALIFIGVWGLNENLRSPQRAIWRSPRAGAITLSIVRQGSDVSIRWNSVPNASSYVVSIFTEDGTLIRRVPATATSVKVTLEPSAVTRELLVRVDAIDNSGRTISESSLQRVRVSK